MAKRPNIGSAGSDLAFALLALIAGWTGLASLFAVLVFACAVASWRLRRAMPAASSRYSSARWKASSLAACWKALTLAAG